MKELVGVVVIGYLTWLFVKMVSQGLPGNSWGGEEKFHLGSDPAEDLGQRIGCFILIFPIVLLVIFVFTM